MSARATFAVLAREADFLEGSGKTDVERMRPGGPNEVYLVRVRLRGPAAGGGGAVVAVCAVFVVPIDRRQW